MASTESFVMKCHSLPFSECNERMLLNAIKKKESEETLHSPLSTPKSRSRRYTTCSRSNMMPTYTPLPMLQARKSYSQ